MVIITKLQCKDIKELLQGMSALIKSYTPTAKEGMITYEAINALQDDAQEIINILDHQVSKEV